MRIFKALVSELGRLESLSQDEWQQEMATNQDLGILIFAAKDELESIAWCGVQVAVCQDDVEDRQKVNQIIERVLSRVS